MKIINDVQAIEKIINYCRKNNCTIRTEDLTARKLESNILTVSNTTHKTHDYFVITGTFSNEEYTKSEGRLLEVLLDLDLLDEDEVLSQTTTGNEQLYRSSIIRQPWQRTEIY